MDSSGPTTMVATSSAIGLLRTTSNTRGTQKNAISAQGGEENGGVSKLEVQMRASEENGSQCEESG
jgi:hypothetical protein